jgi:hypothetical protein
LINSFKHHIRVVSPYIDEQEKELIISGWSLMKSSSDYDVVYIKLNEIAKSNNIELPENKVYSLNPI